MNMSELVRYGLPPEVVELWCKRQGTTLLPLQERVIREHRLFDGGNLLVQAPTSSGKTFVAEMAVVNTALRRKKAVYLVPLKALAEEKWRDFQAKYGAYGMKVVIATRDHRECDADLEGGSFSIAVGVYEKLAQLLVRRPEVLREVGLVVADELEVLSDPDRGGQIEALLTLLVRAGVRVIGLSAVIGRAARLAEWMGAELATHDRRPVDLRQGVLHNGAFRFRTANDGTEAREPLVDCDSGSAWEILTENLAELAGRGEPCMVFVKDKYESRRGAELLARRLEFPAAPGALEALRGLERTHCREALHEVLSQGVAFHNADLSPDERRVVEEAFRAGELRALVSTSTLAAGLNLPARNVFITTEKWQYDARFGMPWKTPILRSEYENMGGRAGRQGTGLEYGRSILVAPTAFDHEALWRRYVEGEREEITPRLADAPLENHVLALVASRACQTVDELCAFFDATPSGRWVWADTLPAEEAAFRVRAAANRAHDAGMIAYASGGPAPGPPETPGVPPASRLEATPFGMAAAVKGVSIASALALGEWIRVSETRPWSPEDLLLAAALTPDGRMLQMSLTLEEHEQADYPEVLRKRTRDEDLAPDVPLNRIRNCNLTPFFDEVRAIKAALVLADWVDEVPVYDIETRYRVTLGQILSAAEQVGWLADAASALARACGARDRFVAALDTLAARVTLGLRAESLAPAARLDADTGEEHGILRRRKAVLALGVRGLLRPEALASAPDSALRGIVTPAEIRRLRQWAVGAAPDAPPPPRVPALEVDDSLPDRVRVDGVEIPVQDKQFRLLRLLATNPGACVPYEEIYEALWDGVVVESSQMNFQKNRLLKRIAAAVPGRDKLIRTLPKRGFLLELEPGEVRLAKAAVSTAA